MRLPANSTVVSSDSMRGLFLQAYCHAQNSEDPDGPINVVVPWEASGTFCLAIELFAGGEKVLCRYVRPSLGHLTHPGRRASLSSKIRSS
jgi:hypothetical protein